MSFAVGCQYDLNGNLTRLTYPGGRFVSYGYDAEDRLKAVTDTYSRVYSLYWDAAGRLTGLHHPNGVNEVFTNNLADRVTALSVTHGSTKIAVRRLAYDDGGRPIRQEMDAGLAPVPPTNTWLQHTHNLADRVTASTGIFNGDRVNVAYTYDGCGSLTNRAWVDADVPAASFTNAFAYGPDGLTTSCTLGTSTISHVYSAAGVRVKETGPSGTRYFAINPADPFKRVLAELDGSGATVRSYIWAGNRLLCLLDSGGTPHYAHGDVQGSVLALTDSSGNVTDQFAYGPYGELYRRTGSTHLPFTWLGGSGVRSLGGDLYATQHRLYDANIKRFIQTDPKGIAGGLNLYAYGNLNPLVYVDPLGLEAQSMGFLPSAALSIPGPTSLSASVLRRISGTSWAEDIHPMAMQCAIDTAFKALATVALLAIPGPEDLAIGAIAGGVARMGGGMRVGALAARNGAHSAGFTMNPWSLVAGAPTRGLPEARSAFYRIARSEVFASKAGFSRIGSANRAEYATFLRDLRSASFRQSNMLQGGFAGMDMSSGQIIMGVSRRNLNSRFALTHELTHLTRHSKGITPFQTEAAMHGIYRYRAWIEEVKTYGQQFFGGQ